jgi:hypothetical protein
VGFRLHHYQRIGEGVLLWELLGVRRRFAAEFPDKNGDNWLLTRLATFVDLPFRRL